MIVFSFFCFSQSIQLNCAVNDKVVVSRACSWEDVNAPADACLRQNTPSYIKTEFCETCSYDGCNGASQYGPTLLLLIIPAIIAKLLTW